MCFTVVIVKCRLREYQNRNSWRLLGNFFFVANGECMWKYGRILQFLVANATILVAMYSVAGDPCLAHGRSRVRALSPGPRRRAFFSSTLPSFLLREIIVFFFLHFPHQPRKSVRVMILEEFNNKNLWIFLGHSVSKFPIF